MIVGTLEASWRAIVSVISQNPDGRKTATEHTENSERVFECLDFFVAFCPLWQLLGVKRPSRWDTSSFRHAVVEL